MSAATEEDATVLHVDDQEDLVDVAATFLEREEPVLSVRTATDVSTAMQKVDCEDIDCVVSDYDMPGKDGLDFLELVREECPDLPFILFTGKGSEEIASQAISAGVDDYIQKETGTDQYTVLANRIRNLVRAYRVEHAIERTEERYHNLIDTAPVPIVLFGDEKELLYANEAAVEYLGADSASALEGTEMPELVHPDDRETALERFGTVMSGTAAGERSLRIRTVDGGTKRGIVATAPGYYQGQPVAQVVLREPLDD